ncbi:MAG: methyltransferase [bacterium]
MNDLLDKLTTPSWTPGSKDFDPLFQLIEAQSHEKDVVRALQRAGGTACRHLVERLLASTTPARGRLTKALQKFGSTGDDFARETLISLITDDDPHTQRMAIGAIGQWKDLSDEAALVLEAKLLAVAEGADEATQRAIEKSLGRIGGEATRAWLASNGAATVNEVMVERRLSRTGERTIRMKTRLDQPVVVEFECKPGLEHIVAAQLPDLECKTFPGLVRTTTRGPLRDLFACRTMMTFRFVMDIARTGDDVHDVTELLTRGEAATILRAFSPDGTRFRLSWTKGKKRATTIEIAKRVASAVDWLVNDPVERDWEVVVDVAEKSMHVTLEPRIEDRRFPWRVADVPAASHPTVAAALVWLSAPQADDVVWDPFMGSGLELCERSHVEKFSRLIGSDNDAAAIKAAKKNFANLGAEVEVYKSDARKFLPHHVTVIVTNPPLGWRVSEESELRELMRGFLENAWGILKPGGRLAWTTRFARQTDPIARKLGFKIRESFVVDLGGLSAHMQLLIKP